MYLTLLFYLIGSIVFLMTLAGTLELLLLTFGGLWVSKKKPLPTGANLKGVILIPAHNEEKAIAETLASLKANPLSCEALVIIDNCTDKTAQICEEYGYQTLIRNDAVHKGKSFALQYAFQLLLPKDYEWFLIIDADTVVEANLIENVQAEMRSGADAVQVRYAVRNPEASLRTRLMHVAFLAFNYLRPRGRQFWGLSSGILGNGFALSRRVLEKVPFQVSSIVEDLSYHIQLVKAGFKVSFIETTTVWSDFPTKEKASEIQRSRWEGGRLALAKIEIPLLARGGIAGNFKLLEILMDLLLLPLGYHVILLMMLSLNPLPFFSGYGLIGLGVVFAHVFVAIIVGKGSFKDFLALFVAPFYLMWKVVILTKIFRSAKQDADWQRTDRE